MKSQLHLYLISFGLFIIILQNAEIIRPIKVKNVNISDTVDVRGSVKVRNTVDIQGEVTIDDSARTSKAIDVNVALIGGEQIFKSKTGNSIGFTGLESYRQSQGYDRREYVKPINWGEIFLIKD